MTTVSVATWLIQFTNTASGISAIRGFLSRFALTFATGLVVNVLIVYLWPLLEEE
jgi:hypothetical protein